MRRSDGRWAAGSRAPAASSAPDPASAPTGTRVVAVVGVAAAVVGLTLFAVQTDWRLLLWAEFALVPLAAWAIAAAARGRGGPAIAAGVVAIATHAETWLASLQGTIEGDLLVGDSADVLTWLAVGQNGAETLLVVGGIAAVAAGTRLAATRNAAQPTGVAPA